MPVTICQLNVYPVKSLAGYAVDRCRITRTGPLYDRGWMVVGADGEFLTQRSHPQMALVHTEVRDQRLVLSGFGMEEHMVAVAHSGMARLRVRVWGDEVNAVALDGKTHGWLSQALGVECKLVAFPPDVRRHCDPKYAAPGEHTHFADGYPLHILSRAAVVELNAKLTDPVGVERFRANLVVDGCPAHAEDGWRRVRVNGVHIRVVKACVRCSVPTVDPERGVLTGPEPIHTLSGYRTRGDAVVFGMTAVVEQEGVIRVGDEVEVEA